MIFLQIILYPFAILYGLITGIRNVLFDLGILKLHDFSNLFVINVGNLAVGGTGKTPHVEYLVRLLNNRKKAILSRGYGRKTEGVIIANADAKSSKIGDESHQYLSKFYPDTKIAVAEKRVEGAQKLIKEFPDLDTIIMDDAFQHRAIGRNLNLLITDFSSLFYNDFMMPSGRLREFRGGARRADAIVISKCPSELSESKQEEIKIAIENYSEAQVFFSKIVYPEHKMDIKKCVLITGIANPKPLISHLSALNIGVVKHYNFGDHYDYKQSDIDKVNEFYRSITVITTEKDFTKIKELNTYELDILELPIEVEFFGKDFDKFVLSKIEAFEHN